ncbi:hypothetical protein CRG98_034364 [Punica granatum]|uniref:Uncharacterized protein n=1 Tax=Punica granatum TaxID=22663 RepID=A0A2I0IML6_PUNGR|nr:hypothetical protein CRG98_034364 [Punica granatum]
MPETSRVGSGSPIGGPSPQIDQDFEFEIPVNLRAGPPICGPHPDSMVTGILCGCIRPRWWG